MHQKVLKLIIKRLGMYLNTKSIKKNQQIVINGVHPFINNKRVGIDTNWQWLTLEKGFNDIEVTGENIKGVKTQWIFPFIYR